MKMLYLVRHATAADRSEPISDFDRPLIEKGKKESEKMADLLKSQGIKPQIFLSSSAIRALETAQIFAKTFRHPKSKIILDEKIYSSSSGSTFIESIKKLDNKKNVVFLFGHEPTISEFASFLVKNYDQSLPKTGVIGIQFKEDSWSDIKKEQGMIKFVQFPKKKTTAKKFLKTSLNTKLQEGINAILEDIDSQAKEMVTKTVTKASLNITKKFLKQLEKDQLKVTDSAKKKNP